MSLNTMLSDGGQTHKWPPIIQFLLCECQEQGQSIKSEWRLVVSWDWEEWDGE
jgi:hypothetical protein